MKLIYIILISSFVFAQNEGAYDGQTPLTVDEIETSENYLHQGQAQRLSQELCENNRYNDICHNKQTAFNSNGLQALESFMPMVSKVFATVVGASNLNYIDAGKTAEAAKVASKGTDVKPVTKSKQDYCGLIAGGVEAGAAMLTQLSGKKTQENLERSNSMSKQAQSFLALANTQKGLRDTARVQLGGWGATAACYGSMAAFGVVQTDPMFWVKLGGSVLMGTFYQVKQKHHNNRFKELKSMADALPKKGDCNPVSETTCFCSEESSKISDPMNYQKYCIPQIIADRGVNASVCVTSSGAPDPNCNCKLTNSCITHKVGQMGLNLNLGAATTKSLLKGISSFGTGLTSSNFKAGHDKNLAFAKKQLAKAPKLKSNPNLNKEQKKLASLIAKLGIPKSIAASIAKLPSKSLPQNIANINSLSSPTNIKKKVYDKKVAVFKKGRSSRRNKKTKAFNPFAKRRGKNFNQNTGIEINNEYYAKAQREAEITKDTSKPIFDIISYRYKKSAWKQFEAKPGDDQK